MDLSVYKFVIEAALNLAKETAKLTATPWDDRLVYALEIIYQQSFLPVSRRDLVALEKANRELAALEIPDNLKKVLEFLKVILSFVLTAVPPAQVKVSAAAPPSAAEEKKAACGPYDDQLCVDGLLHEALRSSVETTRVLVEAHAQLHYDSYLSRKAA